MGSANVNDRSTLEAIYPRDAFERDATANAQPKATVLRGIMIASEVAEDGAFDLQRTEQHVGERDPLGDTLFLAPFRVGIGAPIEQPPGYGTATEQPRGGQTGARADKYSQFLDRIIATASGARFKEPIGQREPRLRGFHGG